MSAADWIGVLTELPRRVIGSLGPTKRDLAPVGSHTYYEPATEKEIIRNWTGWLAELCGLPSGYAAGSLQGRLDLLEAAAGVGNLMDPKVHFIADDFLCAADLVAKGWDNGGGADPWIILGGIRGGIGAPFAQQCLANTPPLYLVDHELEVRCLVHVDAWDTSFDSQFLLVLRDSHDDAIIAGIRIYDYGTEGTPPLVNRRIQGVVGDGLGGVTATDICAFANDTHYELRFRLDLVSPGVAKLYVSVDGAAEVDCGTAPTPTGPHCYLSAAGPHVAAGSGTFHIHQVRRRANWDPDLDP